jgi:Arm DNA-binding domain
MSIRINESTVKTTAAPAKGAILVWDDDVTGFGLRIFAPTRRHPEGARSFFINYRVNGVERRLTIGAFPDWSAKAARDEAKELRRRIDRGEDRRDRGLWNDIGVQLSPLHDADRLSARRGDARDLGRVHRPRRVGQA